MDSLHLDGPGMSGDNLGLRQVVVEATIAGDALLVILLLPFEEQPKPGDTGPLRPPHSARLRSQLVSGECPFVSAPQGTFSRLAH